MTKTRKKIPSKAEKPGYKYELIVYWSKNDNCFLVVVPELPGCMADGLTYQEAVANAEEVIGVWIQCAIEDGDPVPVPKGRLMYA